MIAKSTTLAFMFVPAAAAILCCGPSAHSQGMDSPEIDADSVIRAFAASCDGYSSDELLVRDDLRAAFLRQLTHDTPLGPDAERDAFLKLLQLRKAGKLTVRATRRGQPVAPSVWPVAEIAARVVTDRHRISCDMMLADPRFRTEFLQEARKIAPKVTAPAIGKGVLALRKKRALRPELVLRVVSWEKVVETHTLAELRQRLAQDEREILDAILLRQNLLGAVKQPYRAEAGMHGDQQWQHRRRRIGQFSELQFVDTIRGSRPQDGLIHRRTKRPIGQLFKLAQSLLQVIALALSRLPIHRVVLGGGLVKAFLTLIYVNEQPTCQQIVIVLVTYAIRLFDRPRRVPREPGGTCAINLGQYGPGIQL